VNAPLTLAFGAGLLATASFSAVFIAAGVAEKGGLPTRSSVVASGPLNGPRRAHAICAAGRRAAVSAASSAVGR